MDMNKELSNCSLDELFSSIQVLNKLLMEEEISLQEYNYHKDLLDDAIHVLIHGSYGQVLDNAFKGA